MGAITGKPALMKQMNLSLIYDALIAMGTATRAEIAERTAISATTVRSLLEELLQTGELLEAALDASSGGRRAMRYALNPERNLALCFYYTAKQLSFRVTGPAGNTVAEGDRPFSGEPMEEILRFAVEGRQKWDLRALSVGVPGIVENGKYYEGGGATPFIVNDIGERLEQRLGLPVVLENDLNCIALGFARRYAGTRPESLRGVNLIYMHLNWGCSGAGIIAEGKVVRGATRFAGEVGFLPLTTGNMLDALLKSPAEAADAVARAVACLNCVTNPSLVVIGGERLTDGSVDLDAVRALARTYIPPGHVPEIAPGNNERNDYLTGLSQLAVPILTGAKSAALEEAT